MKNFKKFMSYYKPYKFLFAADMICALIVSAVDLIFPMIVRYLQNSIYVLEDGTVILRYIGYAAIVLVGMYVVKYFCQRFITSWGHIMGARMETDMRRNLFNHLQKLSFSYYDNTNTGKLMSRIVADLFDISELAHHGPEDVVISIIKIIGAFTILMTINSRLTMVLLVITAVMIYFTYFCNKRMKSTFARNKEEIANVNAIIQDSLSGIRVVKSFANEDVEKQKFEKGNMRFLKSKEDNYNIMGRMFSGSGFFQGMLYLTAVLGGGVLIALKAFNVQDLVVYILYINTYLNPIDKLINFTEQLQKGATGFERYLEIMETDPEIVDKKDAVELKNPKGDIEFKDVSFGYSGNESDKVLNHINISIPAGKTVALVGPSGAGKTTLCSLIPRFYEITQGDITIDGISIKDIKLESLRNAIGIVQQDVYLFTGTIKDNIAYGKIGASMEEIIEAAKNANIHDFIMSLEDGYDTFVGERGVRLSGGQKQRISIARVFLKNPAILILDEATSALDNESERYIQKSLEKLAHNRTTLVIAHRLSTIRNADEIIVLTDEGIKERGNHEELLRKNGIYASLYKMQFEGI